MRFPVYFTDGQALVPSEKGLEDRLFKYTSTMDMKSMTVMCNVKRDGNAHLGWILDFDGKFYNLASLGVSSHTPFSLIGLTRRKERYRIEPGRSIKIGELMDLVRRLKDPYPEAPVARCFRETLRRYDPDRIVDNEIMKAGFGV